MKIKAIALGTLAALSIGCEEVKLSKVTVEKPAGLAGNVEIVFGDKQVRTLGLGANETVQSFDVEALPLKKMTLDLLFTSKNTAPEKTLTARILSGIRVKANSSGGLAAEVSPEGKVIANGVEEKDVDCNNLLSVRTVGTEVVLKFSEFSGLKDCRIRAVSPEEAQYQKDRRDPTKIAGRVFSKGGNWFSESDDYQMGSDFTRNYLRDNAGQVFAEDHPVTLYAQRLMDKISRSSDNPNMRPKVFVINANVMNAFALPGGFVFVYRGLIERARSESELAGVLGHEWAHSVARHGTKSVTRAIKTVISAVVATIAIEIIIDKNKKRSDVYWVGSLVRDIGIPIAMEAILSAKSRDAETEADLLGSQYAWAGGFEPWGLAGMFEVFKCYSSSGCTGSTHHNVFGSHPDHDTRIANVQNLSAFWYPAKPSYVHSSEEFEVARRSMNNLYLPDQQTSVMIAKGFDDAYTKMAKGVVETVSVKRITTGQDGGDQ